MEPLLFALGVEGSVGVEVVEGAEAEDGFGSFEAPAGAGKVEAVADC
ncbi:hypothetical protein GCM10023083_13050 [Streptomyces phyllanthi]